MSYNVRGSRGLNTRPVVIFLLYINDLSHVSSILFGLLFADDSNMFKSGKNPDEIIHTTNKEMEKLFNW